MGLGRHISDSDWITKIHVRVVGPGTYDACYETLRHIDPYLESKEWQLATSGHYLNIIKKKEKCAGPALHIAFFAPTERESHRAKPMIDVQVEQIGATRGLNIQGGSSLSFAFVLSPRGVRPVAFSSWSLRAPQRIRRLTTCNEIGSGKQWTSRSLAAHRGFTCW